MKERDQLALGQCAKQYGLELIERGLRGRGLSLDIDPKGNARYSINLAVPEHISIYCHGTVASAARDINQRCPVVSGDVDFDDLLSVGSPFPGRTLTYLTQDRRTLLIEAFMALPKAKLEGRKGSTSPSTFSGSVSLRACSLERLVGLCLRLAQELPSPPALPRDPPGSTLRYFRRRHMRRFLLVAAALLLLTGSLSTSWDQRHLGWHIAALMFGAMTVAFGLGALNLWLGKYPLTALLRLLLFTLPMSVTLVPFLFGFGTITMGFYLFTIPMIGLAVAGLWDDSLSHLRSGPPLPPSDYDENEPEPPVCGEANSETTSPPQARTSAESLQSVETCHEERDLSGVDESLPGEEQGELQALLSEGQVH